ncbi:reticulata-related 4, chloroplastic-like protein [Tanacetum coccineum]
MNEAFVPAGLVQIMAIITDFMLVWLPTPIVSLRPPVAISVNLVTKFFSKCPYNAFQIALAGTPYSLLQRIGALVRNGAKLFVVRTGILDDSVPLLILGS